MEHLTKIVPLVWNIIRKNKKCVVNVTSKENEIIVNILKGKRWKRFVNFDIGILMDEIRTEFHLN